MYLFLCPDLADAVAETLEVDGRIKAIKMLHRVNNPMQLDLRLCKAVVDQIACGLLEKDHKGHYAVKVA